MGYCCLAFALTSAGSIEFKISKGNLPETDGFPLGPVLKPFKTMTFM